MTLPAARSSGACSARSISVARARALQQTSRTSLLLSINGTDRRTDGRTDGRTPDRYKDPGPLEAVSIEKNDGEKNKKIVYRNVIKRVVCE